MQNILFIRIIKKDFSLNVNLMLVEFGLIFFNIRLRDREKENDES